MGNDPIDVDLGAIYGKQSYYSFIQEIQQTSYYNLIILSSSILKLHSVELRFTHTIQITCKEASTIL